MQQLLFELMQQARGSQEYRDRVRARQRGGGRGAGDFLVFLLRWASGLFGGIFAELFLKRGKFKKDDDGSGGGGADDAGGSGGFGGESSGGGGGEGRAWQILLASPSSEL
jgi:hypothetical protein